MGLFGGKDRLSPAADKKARAEARKEEMMNMLQEGVVEARNLKNTAEYDIGICIARAKRAIRNNDMAEKAIAYNELRMHLGLYYYARAMESNIRMMESNARVQEISDNFAGIVRRMNEIKVPAKTMNFNHLIDQAMKGITRVDLEGVEEMTKKLVEGASNATKMSGVSDHVLDGLVSGELKLGDPIFDEQEDVSEVRNFEPSGEKHSYTLSELDELLSSL